MDSPVRDVNAADLPRWYAVCTTPRHEKRVAEFMADRRVELFLPTYQAARQWKKRPPVILTLPLFPTYLFVKIAPEMRGMVLGTPGVLSIVGSSRQPLAIPDAEIEAIRSGVLVGGIEPHPYLAIGEKVKIKTGPFRGLDGILVRKKNSVRLVLSIELIMQSVSIEIDINDVEPLVSSVTSVYGGEPAMAF